MNSTPKSILICGGGTAGWMAANLMQHAWPQCEITLVESPNVGIIGVGEGSTPYLKTFFKQLNIAENEWMPACNATYKVGIKFDGWSEVKGYEQYFHPFFSELDVKPGDPFFHNAKIQKSGINANAHPDHYFVTAEMARQYMAPISEKYSQIEIDYGYHFDSGLLGEFLKKRAISLGLNHISDDIINITTDSNGSISGIECETVKTITAELYIDCTGFRSLLLQQALKVPFHDYKENLFNDSAVAFPTELNNAQPIPVETKSTALNAGWAWKIPLANRYGNGYVYSSKYITPEQAEIELKQHLNIPQDQNVNARHLKMKVGRVDKHWHKNCLAVGLSQGFIEPLEATALMLVQFTIEEFITAYNQPSQDVDLYNMSVNRMMEGIRDYIVTHYVTNGRNDTQYWNDCRNAVRSDNLDKLLNTWQSNLDFEHVLNKLDSSLVYLRPSWYVLLMGVGYFDPIKQQVAKASDRVWDFNKSKTYCEQLVDDVFVPHNQYLQALYGSAWPSVD